MADTKKRYQLVTKLGDNMKFADESFFQKEIEKITAVLGREIRTEEGMPLYDLIHADWETDKYLISEYIADAFRQIASQFDERCETGFTSEESNPGVYIIVEVPDKLSAVKLETIHQALTTYVIRYAVGMWLSKFNEAVSKEQLETASVYLLDASRQFFIRTAPKRTDYAK